MAVARPDSRLYFSVVIPTLRRPEELRATLARLLACSPPPDEVLVVDGDADRSAEPVARAAGTADGKTVKYLASEPGLTRQRNLGLSAAGGDVVVFADDDIAPEPVVFAALADAYRDPAVVGATVRVVEPEPRRFGRIRSPLRRALLGGPPDGTFTRFGYPRYVVDAHAPLDVEAMLGCFMSARREAAERVGFDEELPGYGLAEDEDFSYRLSRLGRIRYLPQASVEHLKTGFVRHDSRELGRQVVRNRAYLFRKNFARTPRTRAQFGLLVVVLLAHRLVNLELRGALGIVEGAATAWREGRG